jgi:hypothetical protein
MNVSRKEIVLIVLVMMMTGLYGYYFTDWLRPKCIRIESSVRSLREAWGPNGRVDPAGKQLANVSFSLHKNYRLTFVQVVPLAEARTNRDVHPLWSLASKSGSAMVNAISYGTPIEGMSPPVAFAEVEPLEPGVEYRLLLQAGSIKGTNDFVVPKQRASR